MSSIQLTRKELYELAWSKPIVQLANEFGLSDNGLRKICKKYEIPLPQMGYWQKVQFGKKVERKKLIHFDKWINTKITINESEANKEHYLTIEARRVSEIKIFCSTLLPVPETLIKPHALIVAAKNDLSTKKEKKSWRNLPECIHTDWNLLSISVQKHNVPRALRIMNTLIKMVELRGHKVILENKKTLIVIDDEKYEIRFREKHTRQEMKNERWTSSELVPNDILSIRYQDYTDKEWVDKGIMLEEKLVRVLAFFELKSIEDKKQRERYRLAQIEADIKREIERKIQAQIDWEKKKNDLLLSNSDQWNKAEKLRQFVTKIEGDTNNSLKVKEWLLWAKKHLDDLDPLSKGNEAFIAKFDIPESLKE